MTNRQSSSAFSPRQDARNLAARRSDAGRSDAGLRVPRGCKHTDAAQTLLGSPGGATMPRFRTDHPYIGATHTRWAPLREFVPEELPGRSTARRVAPQPGTSTREILAIGDQRDLGDGLTPAQRAEDTLRRAVRAALYPSVATRVARGATSTAARARRASRR